MEFQEYQKRPQTFKAKQFQALQDIPALAELMNGDSLRNEYEAKIVDEGRMTVEITAGRETFKLSIHDYLVRSSDGVEVLTALEFKKRFIPFYSDSSYPGGLAPTNFLVRTS